MKLATFQSHRLRQEIHSEGSDCASCLYRAGIRARHVHVVQHGHVNERGEHVVGGLVDKYCAYGPPQRVVDYLAPYIEAGVNYFVLAPIMPEDERLSHQENLRH